MTQTSTKLGHYDSNFQAVRRDRAANKPAWVTELGDRAWSCFTQLGFPTARRGNEKWKYTNVGPIAKTPFEFLPDLDPEVSVELALPPVLPIAKDWTRLVFLDGRFSRVLSSANGGTDGLLVTNLPDAIDLGIPAVQQDLAKRADFEDDGFTALNTAFLGDGAFVQVSDEAASNQVVHLVFVTSDRAHPRVSHPRTLVLVGRNSRLTLVESYAGPSGSQYFTNAVTEVTLGSGAEVDHYRLLLESPQAFHVGTTRVSQSQDSTFSSASFSLGAALARNDFQVLLDGAGASCSLTGLYVTADTQHIDNLISIDHAKPHTTSRLNYKGILDGKSKAVFGGQVLVRKDAQKADAQQTDKNLLLSRQAEVDSKPSLLIYADDVQCGHGATAGHLDDGSLFYMRSRGLDPETARGMLVQAFAREIIDAVKLEPLRNYLDAVILNAIPSLGNRLGGGE